MWRPVQAIAITVAFTVASCSGGFGNAGRIDYARVNVTYSRSDFAYAGSGRDMSTDVLGNPFQGVSQASFDEAVTNAMYGAHFGPPARFTTTPGDSARPTYRVRMLWNGPLYANPSALCSDTSVQGGGAQPGGTARVVAAFCRGGKAATYVAGSVDNVSGPDDPRFVGFVRQVTYRLFPPYDSKVEPGDNRCGLPDC